MRQILLPIVFGIFLVGIIFVPNAFAEITISDDATGGDCTSIGTWDSASRTCTFTSDVSETVVVGSNSITLDGNNHTIDSGSSLPCQNSNYNQGIELSVKTNIVIKNFNIKNFCHGIKFANSISNSILNNVLTDNWDSHIYIDDGTNTIISGNTITTTSAVTPTHYGIWHEDTDSSTAPLIENNNISNVNHAIFAYNHVVVKNNILDSNYNGIYLGDYPQVFDNIITNSGQSGIRVDYYGQVYHNTISNGNTGLSTGACCTEIFENTISNNNLGMYSSNNYVYHNKFLNNDVEANGSGGYFENQQHTSGNYWSDHSTICTDTNSDNFCDNPYPFSGGSINVDDNHVWTVQDGWLSQITNPGNLSLGAADSSGAVGTFSVTATHDGSSMSVTCDTASGITFPIGNSTVTCTATNGIKTAFWVDVSLDSTNPTISVPSDITVVSPDNSGLAVTYDVTASDDFAVTTGPTCTPASGTTFAVGDTTVTCTASDAAGNVGTQTFTVTNNVEDVSPVVTVPADMIISLAQGETETTTEFSFSATDNFAVTVGPTCSPVSGSTFAIGNSTITCTAADAAGNVGTSTFVISIVEYDTTPPTVTVPSDITINEIASNVGGVATFSVDATDNVAVTSGPTCTPISGTTFSVGDTTVTCTAEDANGNVGTATFVITVMEYVPPPISATVTNAPGSASPGCEPNCFIPSTVEISVGGTVTWENTDTAAHTATSGTASSGASGHWDSSLVMAGGSFSHTFDQDGTYHYFCMVHPWMQGSVVVGDGTPVRTAEPEATTIISVSTDKTTYLDGLDNTVQVSGTVFGEVTEGMDVAIVIKSPNGNVVSVNQASVESDGSFSWTINISSFNVGIYTIKPTSPCNSFDCRETTFAIVSDSDLPISATVTNAPGSSTPGCEPNCFIPSTVEISVGGTVTWENTDTAAHTATSGTASDGPSGTFDSSLIMSGGSYSVTLDSAGAYQYFCMVHPWMEGVVLVGGSAPPPVEVEPLIDVNISLNNAEYDLNEIITVSVSVDDISDNQQVIIDVLDPEGIPVVTRAITVSPNAGSTMDFKVSENSLTGNYKIVASVTTGGTTVTESIYFKIKSQYNQFQIASVEVTDQQGNSSTLNRGDMAYIKVTLTSDISIEPLVTVNLFDAELTTLGVGSVKSPLNQGESEIILSFLIPDDAALGDADIFVNAFTNWVSSGGIPLTPEFSITAEISP